MTSQQPIGLMRRVVLRGGPGSGHFGHEGRPGEVGGSLPSDFHSGRLPPFSILREPDNYWGEPRAFRIGEKEYPLDQIGKMFEAHPEISQKDRDLAIRAIAKRPSKKTIGEVLQWSTSRYNEYTKSQAVDIAQKVLLEGNERIILSAGSYTPATAMAGSDYLVHGPEAYIAVGTGGQPNYEGDDAVKGFVEQKRYYFDVPRPIERGGPGSGYQGHKGRPGERGGSVPSGKVQTEPPAERQGAAAPHIGKGYRVNLTNEAMKKYRPKVSAALEWATQEFRRVFGGEIENITVYDDSVAFARSNDAEAWRQAVDVQSREMIEAVESETRDAYVRMNGGYNTGTNNVFINTPRFVGPDGVLDSDGMMRTTLHEYVHWATVGRGRDDIWRESKPSTAFKRLYGPSYPGDMLKQEYVARVVANEILGRDTLSHPDDPEVIVMTAEDRQQAKVLIDKIAGTFVAPNLEMPSTLRIAPETMVDVIVPDGLGNYWGRSIPASEIAGLPEGSEVSPIWGIIKGREEFEEGRTIYPDDLALNWLDETDPARHPTREPITPKPRLDDVNVAIRSKDGILERVLDTIGAALRELMGISNG